jgi:hypothetical protein
MNRALRIAFLALCTLVFLRPAIGQVAVTVAFGPPALPVYELPLCPAEGYLWVPGYWAWDPDFGDYYWVPGTWILAPEPGYLWTPGWWGWGGAGFIFHEGFWAPEVGFYGGINYGFGYFGVGFVGGRWDGGLFRYNTAVLNVNTTIIHNTYIDRTVIVNNVNHVSYNGGQGGITVRPTPEQDRVEQLRHIPPVAAQQQHIQEARGNPQLRASQNQGRPPIAATSRPNEFHGQGVVAAREAGAPYHPPANAPGGAAGHGGNPVHASELQPHQVTPPNTGNPKLDEKYQKQQQKLDDKLNKEHEQLQQKQEQEHQQAQQRNYSQQQMQQLEQKHQTQTQQMQERHTQQIQQLQMRQAPPPKPK